MNEKNLILIAGIGVVLAVVFTMFFYAMNAGTLEIQEMAMIAIVFIIVLAALWLIKDKMGDIRKGLPTKDERERGLSQKAGYYAWMASIWSAIGTMWIGIFLEEEFGFPPIKANYVVAAVVLVSGLVFFLAYFWFRRRGE